MSSSEPRLRAQPGSSSDLAVDTFIFLFVVTGLLLIVRAVHSWWWQRDVVIFWDHDNCHVPSTEKSVDVVRRVYKTAEQYGTVKVFKAYFSPESGAIATPLRGALQKYDGTLISCPRQGKNSKKEVVDRNMIVDMFTHAFDTRDKADRTTFVLITGDGDFKETVVNLQKRQFKFVIISPYEEEQGSDKLRNLGAEVKEWEEVSKTEA